MLELSNDQQKALDALIEWYKRKELVMTLGGYAGTGKTTLISLFRNKLRKVWRDKKTRVAFVSYTGKAARVLSETLKSQKALGKDDYVGTIHSLIYSPLLNNNDEIIGWERQDQIEYDLIIVDEASMVDQRIWKDLSSFNIPVMAVGDHGQLPPINGNFNLMSDPKLKLTEIHRQAKDNPIIKVASYVREYGETPESIDDARFRRLSRSDLDTQAEINDILEGYNPDTLILCGYNRTRTQLNQHIRAAQDLLVPTPEVGDRVICLRNNHEKQIFNGMMGEIKYLEDEDMDWYYAEIEMDGASSLYKGLISAEQFGHSGGALNFTDKRSSLLKGDLFDFGYAITVHKAQGSQAKNVLLFEERFSKMDDEMWKRWLYTGVTRASDNLTVVTR